MDYKVGDKCELEVIDICSNTNGYDYLYALDEDGKTFKIHNILKCQYTSVPNTIYGIVKGINSDGTVRMIQDEPRVLQEHYSLGHYYAFRIANVKKDNNNKQFYTIEDDFCYQRWYSDDSLEVGDDIILMAKAISNNGFIFYTRHNAQTLPAQPSATPTVQPTSVAIITSNRPVFQGGEESDKIEYKTSIVFPPNGMHSPDIDKQMFNIVREIAAFMNAQGGSLYIGIHDKTKEIMGIDEDLAHLTEGEDEYASSYSADYDHYELKIRNTVVSMCSAMAGNLIQVKVKEQEGAHYCQIDVTQAKRPVWVKGNMLFQRQGNQTRMLRGEEITFFVADRIGSDILKVVKNSKDDETTPNIQELIHDAVKAAINEHTDKGIKAPKLKALPVDPDYYVVWYDDGTWKRVKNESQEPNVAFQIPVISAKDKDAIMVFCYKQGTVNLVKFSLFKKGVNLDKLQKDGFYKGDSNGKPLRIFLAQPTSILACFNIDPNGTQSLKLHSLTDFGNTASGKNQGSRCIKSGTEAFEYKVLDVACINDVRNIMCMKGQTSQSNGVPLDSVAYPDEIKFVSEAE